MVWRAFDRQWINPSSHCLVGFRKLVAGNEIDNMNISSYMRIRFIWSLLSLLFVLMNLGCGMNIHRAVYDSMQSVKEQQCLDDPSRESPECLKREPYDVYERKRQQSLE